MNKKDISSNERKKSNDQNAVSLFEQVRHKIILLRDCQVILDTDIAGLYGVETKRINEAVKNNLYKFQEGYMFRLTNEEVNNLRSKFSTTKVSSKSRVLPKVFTEKGLYMLATILKSKNALNVTFAIIETFTQVRCLKRELVDLHKETDSGKQTAKMRHFGKVLSDIVMPDLETSIEECIIS